MPDQRSSDKLDKELKFVLECYEDVSVGELARHLGAEERKQSAAEAGWPAAILDVMNCGAAFGSRRNFAGSKAKAVGILQEELGVPAGWSSLNWNQLPGVVVWELLRLGEEGGAVAQHLIRSYRLDVPEWTSPGGGEKGTAGVVDTAVGIAQDRESVA